jgi:P4 family phage/plasmid primase-like protien
VNCVFDKDEVLELTDKRAAIRELLGEPASERGDEWTYHCRFHDDRHPSFSINVGSGLWTCHGCDVSGDLFRLVEQVEGVSFKEALAWLADRAGVKETRSKRTSRTKERASRPSDSSKGRVINPAIAEQCHQELLKNQNQKALRWLQKYRGWTLDTIKRFKIGVIEDMDGKRFSIPVYDREGRLVNIRKYLPKPPEDVDKFKPFRAGYGKARLFNLAALNESEIILCEGEPDAILASQFGFAAMSSTGGAKTWKDEWSGLFGDKTVHVCFDIDIPGKQGAEKVARSLYSAGANVRIVRLPLDPGEYPTGDLTDYLHHENHTAKDLRKLLEEAKPWSPESSQAKPKPRQKAAAAPGELPAAAATDLGRAEALLARFGRDWKYIAQTGEDRRWDGTRWAEDLRNQRWDDCRAVRSELYRLASQTKDSDLRKAYAELAFSFEKASNVAGAWKFFRGMPGVVALPGDFDRDPMLLNARNGTIDLRSGELRPHDRRDKLTRLAPVTYDADAKCPQWEAFLQQIMADNEELIAFLQRAIGYSLTGDTSEQCFFILHGSGANGKSVLLKVVGKILGDYSQTARIETFMSKKGNDIPEDVANLRGARFVTTSETSLGQRLAEGLVKALTGEDVVRARKLYQNSFQFVPQFKLWMACNHKPVIKGTDEGIWRRIRLVPFNVRIPPEEQDRKLAGKLMEEASGILAWMVRGCLAWQQHGLQPPEAVQAATADYRAESDTIAEFLGETCVVNPLARAAAKDLYACYLSWCEQVGSKPLSQKAFGSRLTEKGFERRRGTGGVHQWQGVGLVTTGVTEVTYSDPISGNFSNLRVRKRSSGIKGHQGSLTSLPEASQATAASDESTEPW